MSFEKKANKYLQHTAQNMQGAKENRFKYILKRFKILKTTRKSLYWQLHIKPKLKRFFVLFKVLDKMPQSVLFMFALIFIFTILMLNQHVVKEYWKNTVVDAFPDIAVPAITDVEGKVQLNPIDRIFTETTARVQGLMWIFFWVMLSIMYGQIARGYVPRKAQTLPKRVSRR